MRKLLCRLLGHPESQRFDIIWSDGTLVYHACLRCGHEFKNNLKTIGDET